MMNLTLYRRCSGFAPAAVLLAIFLAPAAPARADKIVYKNGKFIQGIVQEQYPTRIEVLFEGRVLSIPRSRIESIEIESNQQNLESIMSKATEAIQRGEAAEAKKHIEAARVLDKEKKFDSEIRAMEEEIGRLASHGTAEQRRAAAEKLLNQAHQEFDRIQIDKGLEFLLKSLETDPTYQAAHDEMAKQLVEMIPPPVNLAIEYFSNYVDAAQMKSNHPFVSFTPAALVELRKRLRDGTTAETISRDTNRVYKLTQLIEKHPDWNFNPTPAQQSLLQKGFDGIVLGQIESDLSKGKYETALLRTDAWKQVEPDAAPLSELSVRAWVGMADYEKANKAMEALMESPAPPDWAKLSFNALTNYQTAVDAMKWGQDREAEGLLGTLLSLKGQLLPEVYQLIARTKFKYDEPRILSLAQRGDPSGAADLALRAYDYAVEESMIAKAKQSFLDLAPALAFKPTFVWNLDGIDIPLHTESTDIIKTVFGSQYNLRFSDISPFAMEIRLTNATYNGSGEDLLAQIQDEKAYTIDIYTSDDVIVEMEIAIKVSHPVAPELFSVTVSQPELVAETKFGRTDDVFGRVYFDLLQHSSVDSFLQNEFTKYLPATMADVYGALQLPEKEKQAEPVAAE